jgi:hypothetical protein
MCEQNRVAYSVGGVACSERIPPQRRLRAAKLCQLAFGTMYTHLARLEVPHNQIARETVKCGWLRLACSERSPLDEECEGPDCVSWPLVQCTFILPD